MTDRPRPARPPSDRDRQGPVVRKDADGVRSVGPTWESVTERIIREAQERGEFDDLPNRGRPFVVDENPYAGEMALAFHLLRNAGVAPPWIETDKEVRRLREEIDRLLRRAVRAPLPIRAALRRELLAALDAHDDAVRRLTLEAPSATHHRGRLGGERVLAALDAAFQGDPPSLDGPAASPGGGPPAQP